MDYSRVAKLHKKVFSTPRNSPERTKALENLSEADRAAVFDYDMGTRSGRIKAVPADQIKESEGNKMTYEQFKKKSSSDKSGMMMELSQFAMKQPELYREYREKYQQEQAEEMRLHNRRLSERR